jgi:hypothetical protein
MRRRSSTAWTGRALRACCSVAVLAFASNAAADEIDPVLGLSRSSDGFTASEITTHLRYRDFFDNIEERWFHRDRFDLAGQPLVEQPIFDNSKRATSHAERATTSVARQGTHTWIGIHLRRTGSWDRITGDVQATDSLNGTFPGMLLATRLGLDVGALSLYALGGAGSYRLLSLGLMPGAREFDWDRSSMWSGAVLGGFGLDCQLGEHVQLGVEVSSLRLTARSSTTELLSPDPIRTIQTGLGALRVKY